MQLSHSQTHTHIVKSTGCWRPRIFFFCLMKFTRWQRERKISGVEGSSNYLETQILKSKSVYLTKPIDGIKWKKITKQRRKVVTFWSVLFSICFPFRNQATRTHKPYSNLPLCWTTFISLKYKPNSPFHCCCCCCCFRLPHCFKCITNSKRRSAECWKWTWRMEDAWAL